MTRVATEELERLVRDASPENNPLDESETYWERVAKKWIAQEALRALAPDLAAEVLDGRRKLAAAEKALEAAGNELAWASGFMNRHGFTAPARGVQQDANKARAALAELRKEATK